MAESLKASVSNTTEFLHRYVRNYFLCLVPDKIPTPYVIRGFVSCYFGDRYMHGLTISYTQTIFYLLGINYEIDSDPNRMYPVLQ